MYLTNNEITVKWIIPPTDTPLLASDYDISIVLSSLAGTYTDGGIVNYSAPGVNFSGTLEYLFTPLAIGRYRLVLSTGTGASYTIIDEKDFWVFENAPTQVNVTKILSAKSYPQSPLVPTLVLNELNVGFPAKNLATDGAGNWVAITTTDLTYYSNDDARTWTQATDVVTGGTQLSAVEADSDGNFLILGIGTLKVWRSTNAGVNWTKVKDGGNIGSVNKFTWYPPTSQWIAGGNSTTIAVSTDATGSSWSSYVDAKFITSTRPILQVGNMCLMAGFNIGATPARCFINNLDPDVIGNWLGNTGPPDPPGAVGLVSADTDGTTALVARAVNQDLYSTSNGSAWSTHTHPGTGVCQRILWSEIEEVWIIFDDDGDCYESTDLTNWTQRTGGAYDTLTITNGHDGASGARGWAIPTSGNNILVNTPDE